MHLRSYQWHMVFKNDASFLDCLYKCQVLEYMKYFASFTILTGVSHLKLSKGVTRTVVQVSDVAPGPLVKKINMVFDYSFTLMLLCIYGYYICLI